ncbi:hypothetical protein GOP47_0017362 [Adiantum capillus-veneris]|uniref:Uncharacterized protein n=1 Tax=Adiantum capillus-veneris TaxID=13818 RepID=A0A9D4Z9M4_ADICA|nr:hypothetical protein GOP47_0017362 [Adiantum capillus-veneris]
MGVDPTPRPGGALQEFGSHQGDPLQGSTRHASHISLAMPRDISSQGSIRGCYALGRLGTWNRVDQPRQIDSKMEQDADADLAPRLARTQELTGPYRVSSWMALQEVCDPTRST